MRARRRLRVRCPRLAKRFPTGNSGIDGFVARTNLERTGRLPGAAKTWQHCPDVPFRWSASRNVERVKLRNAAAKLIQGREILFAEIGAVLSQRRVDEFAVTITQPVS
jgi:hypothetical protein